MTGRRISSIFMGGGTPSIFSAQQIRDVLEHCRQNFLMEENVEITMEANPGTVNPDKLAVLKDGGINRLSFGVESIWDDELSMLGRAHSSRVALEAYAMARKAGFENVNLDFIYGLPGQSLDRWKSTLDLAVGLGPEHISAYALTIEEGTPFELDERKGTLRLPDEERQIRFDEITQDRLSEAGYIRYEVSNYSRPGYACRHNLGYWDQQEYLGFGPGAHSYFGGRRFSKVEDIDAYIMNIETGGEAIEMTETIGPELAGLEALIFGLRKTNGIDLEDLRGRFPSILSGRVRELFDTWSQDGLAVWTPPRFHLTSGGLRLLDRLALDLLPEAGSVGMQP